MKSIYIAPFCTKVHTKRPGMDHTALPANSTMPAFPSWRSPDVTTTATAAADIQLQLTTHLLTRKDERLSWPRWASGKLCGIEEKAPPIFGRATITLGIGPHSFYVCIACMCTLVTRCGGPGGIEAYP